MRKLKKSKKGMLVLAITVAIIFVSIIFASLFDRMRSEALLTNRVSTTERLNQLACAIGRLSIRKLQRDIELKNTEEFGEPNDHVPNTHGSDIVNAIVEGKDHIKVETYTDVIVRIPIVKKLKEEFEKEYGNQGKIEDFINVSYVIHLDKKVISVGGEIENNIKKFPFSKRGFADLIITITMKNGLSRKYTIRKDFVLATLLAPPFCRYTLFSHKGATINNNIANSIKFDSNGEIKDSKRPLVCINRLIEINSNMSDFKYPTIMNSNTNDVFVKNGWIYLGGSNTSSKDMSKNNALLLNIVPGSNSDDDLKTRFGEFFHFYYNPNNAGWLQIDNWDKINEWIDQQGSEVYGYVGGTKAQISFVNYGLYDGLLNLPFGSMSEYELFRDVARQYNDNIPIPDDTIKNGFSSSMHLFGTPNYCTPTLIFGKVNRRYLKAFGLYFPSLKRVFPLKTIANSAELTSISSAFSNWYSGRAGISNETNAFNAALQLAFNYSYLKLDSIPPKESLDRYYKGAEGLCGIAPRIVDTEPYVNALINMANYSNPSNAAFPKGILGNKDSNDLCNQDFEFSEDDKNESLYKGHISQIKIDYDEYLKEITTYTLGKTGETYKIDDDNDFFNNHFFIKGERTLLNILGLKEQKEYFLLNQVIRIKGDLEINKELLCGAGGVIVCEGKVTIKKPILNRFLHDNVNGASFNKFGFLTIVAKKGIEITNSAACDDSNINGDSPLPRFEAFLVAGCEANSSAKIQINKPMRIVGGVAADEISDLVKQGCIIEWGFKNGEMDKIYDKNNHYATGYCGLTLGPRDIEIYTIGPSSSGN